MIRPSKQKIITKYIAEAEMLAVSDKMHDLFDLHEFVFYQGIERSTPTLYLDNQSSMVLIVVRSKTIIISACLCVKNQQENGFKLGI